MAAMRLRTAAGLGSLPILLLTLSTACNPNEVVDHAPTGTGASTSASSSSGTGAGGAGGADVDPKSFYYPPAPSCAYECATLPTCSENTTPFACPTVGPWANIPHASSCPAWDGTYPAPVTGQCTATAPTGDALKRGGPDPTDPTGYILPDARRLHPAGVEWILDDAPGGLTSQVLDVPGTPYVVTVDTGTGDHIVRTIDTTLLAAGMNPVASEVHFAVPETLNWGMTLAGTRVFVTSADGAIHAIDVDTTTGALTRDDAAAIALPMGPSGNLYVSGVAASPDGTKLVVSGVATSGVLVFSIAGDATYGMMLGQTDVGADESFGVWFDPHDPTGATAYVSLWANAEVAAIDLTDPTAPTVKTTYATGKDPEGIAFLDGRFMVVATSNGDALSIVDRAAGTVASVPIEAAPALHGGEPSLPAVDPATGLLYVTISGDNAVAAFDVDTTLSPPTVTRAGRLGTGWWPSGVVVRADGSLVVTTLRGHGGGPIPMFFGFGDNDIGDIMKGSVAWIPMPAAADLAAGDTQVGADDDPGALTGAPAVDCPAGAQDFPLPATNDAPSPVIDHVFFILRENKNYDSLLGDMPGADGEPSYTLEQAPGAMDALWHNFREAAREFAFSDNYYTDAVFSTQGHVLATYGRSSDFNERTWIISGQRADSPRSIPGGGVDPVGQPLEGSLFDWLFANQIPFNILGEIDGAPVVPAGQQAPLDIDYPGVAQAITVNDLPKACYAAGRVRVGCNLGNFVYQTLPNDHTIGVSSSNPTPETMCAVNDEATGIMLDAISHSPYWKSSIVFITEDDPSSGGEHVDCHRTPFVVVSPWVQRGYVSSTHIDIASVHKMYAHLFGKPYPNRQVAQAMLPFDIFTSTPDYTPFTYTPRTWPLACGTSGPGAKAVSPAEEELTSMWDFSHEDQQPGLAAQVVRAMRGTPLTELTPEMKARVRRRQAETKDDDD
jgi:DNA-binding beta-propeller fold protein YncE